MAKHGVIVAVIVLMFAAPAAPQRQTGGETPAIAEKTAGMQKLEGFFNYWEEKAERMWLEIGKTGAEFLYVTDLSSSIEGRNRGSWSGGQVMRFDRHRRSDPCRPGAAPHPRDYEQPAQDRGNQRVRT